MSAPDPWEGLLDPDEQILWQGQPKAGFRLDTSNPMMIFMGVFFMGFSIFWMKMASQAGGYFWMFGLLFFGTGFYNSIGVHFWKSMRSGATHYTLTNKRGFIATNVMGRKTLTSHNITKTSPLELTEGALSSVTFAHIEKRNKNGHHSVDVQFQNIEEGRKVFALIRDIQREAL
ncbi:MAG: aspartate carbamoyltransferase catalytic subunit [Sedimentitalea sp.]